MKREEIIKKFCELSAKVMEKKFKYAIPADCFCEHYDKDNFQFDQAVIDFIIDATNEKLEKER